MGHVCASLCVLIAMAAPVFAAEPSDPYLRFATCAGRYSALMEHHWLMGAPEADQTRANRQGIIDLLDTSPAVGPGLLARRIEAKHLLARTLQRAEFATSPQDRRIARAGADRAIAECRALVLE